MPLPGGSCESKRLSCSRSCPCSVLPWLRYGMCLASIISNHVEHASLGIDATDQALRGIMVKSPGKGGSVEVRHHGMEVHRRRSDKVRHVSEAIAVVVAESRD